jgi:pyruvate,water dikinase
VPPPDTSVFPRGIRRVMNIVVAAVANLEVDPLVEGVDLHGLGVGSGVYRGVARVATDPDAVLETMEPGDVLVAPWTAPTYNAVLAIAGAVVVQEGGLLSHAAVMARELGIPAVIGCRRAMDLIGDGGVIDVDADAGEVRLVART